MSTYDPTLFWGDTRTAHRPAFYRECCICIREILHGEEFDSSHGQIVHYAHTECRKLADNHPMRGR